MSQTKGLDIDVKLNSKNYSYWKFKMLPLLEDEGIISYTLQVTPTPENQNPPPAGQLVMVDTPRAKRAILVNVCEEIGTSLMTFTTAKQMWDFLYNEYSGKNEGRKFIGIKRLAQFNYEKASLKENLKEIQNIVQDTVIAAGSDTFRFDDLAVTMFLNCLPERFHATRSILEQSKETLTIKTISEALLAEDERIQTRESTNEGFAAVVESKRSESKRCRHDRAKKACWTCDPSLHPSKFTCQDCQTVGHKTKNSQKCPKFEKGQAIAGFSADAEEWNPTKPFAGVASRHSSPNGVHKKTKPKKSNDLRFVIDSGCTQTLLRNKEIISNYTDVNFEMQTASTDVLQCPGKGEITLNSDISIKNAMFSPDATMNLLSVSQICDLGNKVHFDAQHATVYNKSGRVILRGKRVGGLYLFNQPDELASISLLTRSSDNTQLFHRRMGHLNIQSLRLLSHISHGIVLDGNPTDLCVPCTKAKTHRRTFPQSTTNASRIGEIIHSDICYIGIPTIIGDYKMFILFTDDCGRYMKIYLLRAKSDAAEAFKDYDRKLFNMIGKHVSTLKTDCGTEYFNNSVKEYCRIHGITQLSSTPYTPQQNARAERPNRSIIEGVSAMLLDAKLPWEYWGFAAKAFIYLKNRSPHSALSQSTPYSQWFKVLPDLSHVRVFGSTCHAFIPKQKRTGPGSKLLPKTKQMILVGYSDLPKTYKLFNPETLEQIESSEVIFENELTISSKRNISYPTTFADYITPTSAKKAPVAVMGDTNQANNPTTETNQTNNPSSTADATPNSITTDVATNSTDVNEENSNNQNETDSGDESPDEIISYYTRLISLSQEDEELLNTVLLITNNPDSPSLSEAMNGKHREQFKIAISKEYQSLDQHQVFSKPMKLPEGKVALKTKMVLKIKEAESELLDRIFKARLCIKGYTQQFEIDYFFTFAPVAAYNSVRMFVSICASIDYELDNIDVKTAFLHAPLEEEIYIKIPYGYPVEKGQENMVLRLLKALYGLKQAPYSWNKEIDEFLKSLGFKQLESDRCIYVGTWNNATVYLLVYVDDILIGTSDRTIMANVKSKINEKFPCKDHGPITFFLNMHFIRNWKNHTISIHQESKIAKVINDTRYSEKDRLTITKACKIPASSELILSKDMCPTDPIEIERMSKLPYKSILGQLLYISITARPDISTAVSACGRYAQNPGEKHWEAILQIVRYLQGTRKLRLRLGGAKNIELCACSDADWAADLDQRNSRTGYTISLGNSLIVWNSKLQQSIANSSTEAEYIALAECSRTLIWCRTLLSEMGFSQTEPSVIDQDNKSTIKIATSYKQHPGIKHIDIKHHFIRDRIMNVKDITLRKKPSQEMQADLLTKQLAYPAFVRHRESFGLHFSS